jgi:hypothetical protein
VDKYGKPFILKEKTVDYGYAITAHKSQGSTYDYAMVDETTMEWLTQRDILAANQARYVAFSRASKGVIAKTNRPIKTKDFFDFTNKPTNTEGIIVEFESKVLDAMAKDGLVNKKCKL